MKKIIVRWCVEMYPYVTGFFAFLRAMFRQVERQPMWACSQEDDLQLGCIARQRGMSMKRSVIRIAPRSTCPGRHFADRFLWRAPVYDTPLYFNEYFYKITCATSAGTCYTLASVYWGLRIGLCCTDILWYMHELHFCTMEMRLLKSWKLLLNTISVFRGSSECFVQTERMHIS